MLRESVPFTFVYLDMPINGCLGLWEFSWEFTETWFDMPTYEQPQQDYIGLLQLRDDFAAFCAMPM